VVVDFGVTVAEPDSGNAVVLKLGAIATEVAFVLFQVNLTDCPVVISLADAWMLTVGAGGVGPMEPQPARQNESSSTSSPANAVLPPNLQREILALEKLLIAEPRSEVCCIAVNSCVTRPRTKSAIVSCKRRRSRLVHHLFTILITNFNLELRQSEREEHILALHSLVIPAAAKG
jgi:hypothetical protein